MHRKLTYGRLADGVGLAGCPKTPLRYHSEPASADEKMQEKRDSSANSEPRNDNLMAFSATSSLPVAGLANLKFQINCKLRIQKSLDLAQRPATIHGNNGAGTEGEMSDRGEYSGSNFVHSREPFERRAPHLLVEPVPVDRPYEIVVDQAR
jgi:hypothetical protein